MYEKLSDRAREAMHSATEQARRFNHPQVSPEHVLLALVDQSANVACDCLKEMGVDGRRLRLEIEKRMLSYADPVGRGRLPLASRTKRLIELAMNQVRTDRLPFIGAEHLLLGMFDLADGVVGEVLTLLGATKERALAMLPSLVAAAGDRIAGQSVLDRPTLAHRLGCFVRKFRSN